MKLKRKLFIMAFIAAWFQIFAFVGFACSIIAWPFFGWTVAWRMGLTSLVCILLFALVYNGLNNHVKNLQS